MQSPLEAFKADSRALSLANIQDDDLSFRRARQVDAHLASQCGYGTSAHPIYPRSTPKRILPMLLAL